MVGLQRQIQVAFEAVGSGEDELQPSVANDTTVLPGKPPIRLRGKRDVSPTLDGNYGEV